MNKDLDFQYAWARAGQHPPLKGWAILPGWPAKGNLEV